MGKFTLGENKNALFVNWFSCMYMVHMHRGKGDYYRLGTDSSSHVMKPQHVEAMTKKVVQIAVGSLHCLALTESGEVCIYE